MRFAGDKKQREKHQDSPYTPLSRAHGPSVFEDPGVGNTARLSLGSATLDFCGPLSESETSFDEESCHAPFPRAPAWRRTPFSRVGAAEWIGARALREPGLPGIVRRPSASGLT